VHRGTFAGRAARAAEPGIGREQRRMAFFERLTNLWSGFLSLWITDVEKNHPEIAYENAINGMIEKYTQLKRATAAIIRRREDLDQQLKARTTELANIEGDLSGAVATDQQDLGMILLQKQKALLEQVAELRAELDIAVKDSDSAKSSLLQVQSEIKKLKAEKDRMLAKMASAQARVRIQDQLEGLSVEAEVRALDNVREHIKDQVAQANLGKELAESDLDTRLSALRSKGGEVTAKAEWERLRNAAAAQNAQQQKKTM
jgi:phage shock protein A